MEAPDDSATLEEAMLKGTRAVARIQEGSLFLMRPRGSGLAALVEDSRKRSSVGAGAAGE
ncbi:hypothetical protein [Arthrobacter rhizosphaerae]|uniref:hypothetical protein n=1 Tax=Arthrobacter rhizosphaerae TaxID=2855490 RepID=UPI001FF5A37F|nr:hypothetical protein [Arthrobacter rhizosphaerae]